MRPSPLIMYHKYAGVCYFAWKFVFCIRAGTVVDDLGLLEEGLARAVLPDTVARLGLMYDFERIWYREIYNV
ncbi:hypothetical protein FHS72_002893 [Loktanella ponticola]|uniref:Uncharacterized protein n=1 Tax=Yoonia ponticola TaxID=1524255 RepID=A0A7W9BMG5_9RHOB|nr:hypothetical protein [Yoonia ponticola]